MLEEERNTRVIRSHFAALDNGDADLFASTFDDGFNHAPAAFDLTEWPGEGKPYGPAEARETHDWLHAGLSGLHIEIEHLVAVDSEVIAWIRMTGTLNGLAVDFRHAHRFRLRDGRIVEHWAVRDDLRALLQAGVISPPGEPKA